MTDAGPDLGLLRTGHVPGKAKRVISIHMWGAVSQVDTFDYKPKLIKMPRPGDPALGQGQGQDLGDVERSVVASR